MTPPAAEDWVLLMVMGSVRQCPWWVLQLYWSNYNTSFDFLIPQQLILLMMKRVNQDVHSYIVNHINSFVEPLVTELVKKRPADPLNYSIIWLTHHDKNQRYRSRQVIESDVEDEGKDEVRDLTVTKTPKKKHTIHRKIGSSEEVFGEYNDRAELELTEVDNLCQKEKQLMKAYMDSSILFQNLDSKDEEIIMKAMMIKQTEEYEVVVKEGESGNHFYIVSEGEFDCYKLVNGENTFLTTYKPGDSFGELSLMYNSTRAASVLSNKPGKLLSLDRSIFSHILKVAALRKQIIIKKAIDKVQLLKCIPTDQKYNLINILKQEKYEQNDYVLKEGEVGDKFYIVLEGKLVAEKMQDGGGANVVLEYHEGDYFGELALINNQPRQASVKVMSHAKLAWVSREEFKRVFGSIYSTLQQKTDRYHD